MPALQQVTWEIYTAPPPSHPIPSPCRQTRRWWALWWCATPSRAWLWPTSGRTPHPWRRCSSARGAPCWPPPRWRGTASTSSPSCPRRCPSRAPPSRAAALRPVRARRRATRCGCTACIAASRRPPSAASLLPPTPPGWPSAPGGAPRTCSARPPPRPAPPRLTRLASQLQALPARQAWWAGRPSCWLWGAHASLVY